MYPKNIKYSVGILHLCMEISIEKKWVNAET